MKDALTYRVAIEIQDIIFKTQTVRSGISACTRLRLSLRRLTPCGSSRKHLCKFFICKIDARFYHFFVWIQSLCEFGMHRRRLRSVP